MHDIEGTYSVRNVIVRNRKTRSIFPHYFIDNNKTITNKNEVGFRISEAP